MSFDCVAASLASEGRFTEADCLALPKFAEKMLENLNFGWSKIDLESYDGYPLTMVRLTTDNEGTPLVDTKGPLMLVHGLQRDALSMLCDCALTYPTEFALAGYDVYMVNLRGTPGSKGTTAGGVDPDDIPAGTEAWWDFDDITQGKNDIPAFVNAILQNRYDESAACQKV